MFKITISVFHTFVQSKKSTLLKGGGGGGGVDGENRIGRSVEMIPNTVLSEFVR